VFLPFRRIHDTDPFLVDSGNFVEDAYYLGGAAIMDDSTISKKRPFKLGRIKTIFCCSYPHVCDYTRHPNINFRD
jgi:hypothetical protein